MYNTSPTPSVNRLDQALALAAAGWHVFRVKPNSKAPLAKGWQSEATTDSAVIRQWFQDNPQINYGVAPQSGQVVVDLDCKGKANGIQAFETLALDAGELYWADATVTPTFAVETASGGYHLYLDAPFDVSNSGRGMPAGVDVRGLGGLVVGPGSTVGGKAYKALSPAVKVSSAPAFVTDRLRHAGAPREPGNDNDKPLYDWDTPANVEEGRRYLEKRSPAIEYQNGNDHTYATFAALRQRGVSLDKALEIVSEPGGWNEQCEPPWEYGELERIASNAYRYAKEPAGSRPSPWETFAEASESTAEGLPVDDVQDVGPALLPCYMEGELDALPAWSYLIDDVLPEASLHMVHGQPDALKTFTALDLVMHGADGRPWPSPPRVANWAQATPVKQYRPARKLRVAYLATEGVAGLRKRVRAWKQHHGVED